MNGWFVSGRVFRRLNATLRGATRATYWFAFDENSGSFVAAVPDTYIKL